MRTQTILIVDDEEKNIKLLKAMLMAENYRLRGVLSGEEALRVVAETPPDLILLDVMMAGIDGFEVCRRLKEDEKTRMIPIAMVTALREKGHRIKAMEVGADDFLSKPVDQTELLVRVKSLLRIKSYQDDLIDSYREVAKKNAEIQELERIKDGLTHMIIHDLKNPLTAISGNIQLILAEKPNLSERQLQKMKKCFDYCQELGCLIRSLLEINRIEEGKLTPDKEDTNLTELIDDVLEQFKPRTEEKHASLSFSRPGDIPSIRIDRGLIRRVIANLLDNAIRHTPAGGAITVAVDSLPEKGGVCLSVKDNGNGLAPEYGQKVFDKFEQAKLRRDGVLVGRSGLGLTFCKIAVEAHGGKIWVESEGEGKGCTFKSVIPV
jgi:signal transduction histidine kinase